MNCKYCEIPFCDESTVSRFINDRRHLKKDDIIKITPNAFIYPKENKALSLVHINNLTESEIWDISDTKIFKNARLSEFGTYPNHIVISKSVYNNLPTSVKYSNTYDIWNIYSFTTPNIYRTSYHLEF
jgi:hypothetical protein